MKPNFISKLSVQLVGITFLLTGCVAGEPPVEEAENGQQEQVSDNNTNIPEPEMESGDESTDDAETPPSEEAPTDIVEDSEEEQSETSEEEVCVNDFNFFSENVWTPIISADCVICHTPTGVASFTGLTFVRDNVDNHIALNLASLTDFLGSNRGRRLILNKPTNVTSHGGGQRLGMTTNSATYAALEEMNARARTPIPSCPDDETSEPEIPPVEEPPADEESDTPPVEEMPEEETPGDEEPTEEDPEPPVTEDPEQCVSDSAFFEANIWNGILVDCVACHHSSGVAQSTDFVLAQESDSNHLTTNFGVLNTFTSLTGSKVGAELILDKPTNTVGHGGGQRLGMTTSSQTYADLQAMMSRFETPTVCDEAPEPDESLDVFSALNIASSSETLRKAAILFAGRVPTSEEYQTVQAGTEQTLRQTIRSYMTGDNFANFLMESANNHLLTNKYANYQTPAIVQLEGVYNFPNSEDRIDNIRDTEGEQAGNLAWARTSNAIAEAPMRLIANVVLNERPYSEILTANYMMVNPWSASFYQSGNTFVDDTDDYDWQEGTIQNYRLGNYPHAGLLSSPMFLARFPSTATNRNRARSRWVYQFFLGIDIEALASRPTDSGALADTNNPTLNNPNCTVCHTVLDPVAGAFQNWGDTGRYLQFNSDSLPETYKETDLYTNGDRWYSDMLAPGFNGVDMPVENNDTALQWLASQIVADPRFATGTVKFWYSAVFGDDIIIRPVETSDANYASRLAAYNAQNDLINNLAARFSAGTAGTASNGALNLKDLFVDMALSEHFTATSIDEPLTGEQQDSLAEVGAFRLLTPEQLNRKLIATTGFNWRAYWDGQEPFMDHSYLVTDYFTFFGGIDSDGITDRISTLNSLMYQVVARMANETSCHIVLQDFERAADNRLLFTFAEQEHTPLTSDGQTAIQQNIQYLYEHLLGETLTLNEAANSQAYALFNELWQRRVNENRPTWFGGETDFCRIDWEDDDAIKNDPNQTIHAWIAVINFLLTDYRFIHL